MWGTDWEDQPVINARNLKQLLPTSMIFNWKSAQLDTPARGSLLSMFKTAQTSVLTTTDSAPKSRKPEAPADDNTERPLLEMSNTINVESPNGKLDDTQKRIPESTDPKEKVVASPPPFKKAKPSPNKRKGSSGSSSTITSFFKPATSGM